MPLISIIIPAYNASRTILETIDSIQNQTFSDFEIIVVDDGSTDNTLELLNENIDDPRLKVFSYKNGGVSAARNHGVGHANGEFISFIDADDLWVPNKLELQLASLQQNPEAAVAYSWTSFMGENREWTKPCAPLLCEGYVYPDLLAAYFIYCGSNALIRREAIRSVGGFDTTLTHGEDWDFYLRLAQHYTFVSVREYQILYRQSSTSAASNIPAMHESNLLVLDRAFRSAPPKLQQLKKKCFSNVYLYSTELCLKHGKNKDTLRKAFQYLWIAIYLYPKNIWNKYTHDLARWLSKRMLQILA